MKIFKNKWFWIVVTVMAVSVWWQFGHKNKVIYETETVYRGDIYQLVNVSGVLEPDNSVDVSFELTGTVRSLYADKGESVEKGDMLAKMDDAILQSQKQEAILAVKTAVQSEWLARRSWDELKPEEREIKKLASESARVSLSTLERNITRTVLRAPVSGKITRKYVEAGEVVTTASPIFQIVADGSGVLVEADVPESDIAKISVGQDATVTFDALTKKDIFHAKVDFIDPRSTVIQDVVYYRTKFVLMDGDERLKTGMSADADVETAMSQQALLISRRAIKEDDKGVYVEVYDGMNKTRRDVETGLEDDEGNVEILKGLFENEKVVVGKTV